jgi:hypothetical protein
MNETINRITVSDLSPSQGNRLHQRTGNDLTPILERVKPIIEAMRLGGDQALARFAGSSTRLSSMPVQLPQLLKISIMPRSNSNPMSGPP